MRYSVFLLPVAATATAINFFAPHRLGLRDRVATDRFRTFSNDEAVLPHSVKPYMIESYEKRDTNRSTLSYGSKKDNGKTDDKSKGENDKDHDDKDDGTNNSDKEDDNEVDDKKKITGEDDLREMESYDPDMFEKAGPMPEICRKDDHIIETSGDLYSLQAQCDTLLGNLHFTNYDDVLLDFGNIQSVKGGVYVEKSSHLVRIEGSKLQAIGETFSLKSLTSLVSVNLPHLKEARVIEWKVLPILNEAIINDNLGGIKRLTIADTSLSVIEGFRNVDDVEVFQINNNRFLETVKANIKFVRQKLSVHANARETELEMPKLLSAENITVRDTSLAYFPKLETVGSSFELIQNQFSEIQLPNLKTVGGTLGVIENPNLKLANFNNVTDIEGGLMIANNTRLEKIDFFSSLKQIGGAIYFEGKFSDTDFPQLKLVKGSALVRTNSGNMDCSKWTTPKNGRSIVRGGKITCTSGRRQKSQSVSQDGAVLSETVEDHGSNSESGSESKGSFLSNSTNSASANFGRLNLSWMFCLALITMGRIIF